ncbi:hypothetical protein HXX76_004357 [Chlamydomonas incerta]|uniref:DEP domain-containing protein n=1 Tax=Chlamydomonas incerta TaxID=51695 RepID=A0A835W5K2_CHLIN|nr:hypothetical protein HXX76_004357 [Chlamydomonas incerta]|eukprot:KAG2440245.1 hypothetical protein HXX76_004357 [Chlamydomonas incerta]
MGGCLSTSGSGAADGFASLPQPDLLQLAAALRGGVRIKDRRYLFRCYRACFVGQEAVAWLVAAGAAAGPAEAVALGNSMMEAGLFHHVVYEHRFEDDYLFYRFTDDDYAGGAAGAAGALAAAAAGKRAADKAHGSGVPAAAAAVASPRSAVAGGGIGGPGGAADGAVGGAVGGADVRLDRHGSTPTQESTEACGAGDAGTAAGGGGGRALLLSEPRQDRSRQVMTGHLQQLQGRVTRMAQAAEAQRAIADILVAEVSSLRAEAAAARADVAAAAAAAAGAAAAAAHAAQQAAALRVLCFGLCACVLQQSVVGWLADARAAAGATAGAPGAGLLVLLGRGGPSCWGLALAVAVALLGFVVVLFPPPPPQAAAVAATPAAEAAAAGKDAVQGRLQRSLAAAGPGASGSVEGAASEGRPPPPPALRASFGERLLSSVYATAAGSARASEEAGGAEAESGAAELSRALAELPGGPGLPAPRVSSSSGGGSGSSFTAARRAKEMARALTAPLRLHLPGKGKRAKAATAAELGAAGADGGLSPAPAGLCAQVSASPISASGISGSAAASGVAGGAAGTAATTVQLQASCSQPREQFQALTAAVSGRHQHAADAAKPLPKQAPIPHVPGPADFCGWPDAPVLLAFNTAQVPEHAAAAAAAVAEAAAAGAAAAVAADATAAGCEAAGGGGSEGGAGDSPQVQRSQLSSASSMVPPQAAQPLALSRLLRLPANDAARPIRVETELFSGEVLVFLRGLATTPDDMFCGRKRMSWVAMQGRFKTPLSLDSVVTGQEFGRPFRRLPAPWFVEKVLLSMARQVSPSMRVGPLSAPHMLMPLIAAAQLVNISEPGTQPHLMRAHEDVRLMCPSLAVKAAAGSKAAAGTAAAAAAAGGAAAATRPASADARRRHYINPRNRAGLRYDTARVYTFHFYQQWVDLAAYRLDFGYTYDLVRHLDGQPLQIMAKDVDSGKYLYSINVWNERLLPPPGAPGAGAGRQAAACGTGAATAAGAAGASSSAGCEEEAPMQDAESDGSAGSGCSDADSFQDAEEEGQGQGGQAGRRQQAGGANGARGAGGGGEGVTWLLNADWGVPLKCTPQQQEAT